MTSAFVEEATTRQAASSKRRAAYHEQRIRSAPAGSRKRRLYVLNWLQAELANGSSLDEVLELTRSMNGRAG